MPQSSSNKDNTVLFFPFKAETQGFLNKMVIKLTVLLGCKVRTENTVLKDHSGTNGLSVGIEQDVQKKAGDFWGGCFRGRGVL